MKKRFVIISHGRTGSTALCNALNEHPEVCCAYELFAREAQGAPRADIIQFASGRGDDYLRLFFEADFAPVVGYKMFTFHGREDEHAVLAWDYLLEHPDIHVIFLSRRNLIDSFLSEKFAAASGNWGPGWVGEAEPKVDPVWVDLNEADLYMFRVYAEMAWARVAFAHHPGLTLWYEDLATNFQGEFERVLRFLGLESQKTSVVFQPNLGSRAAQFIENHEVLMQRFRNSIFSSRKPDNQY
ncbi:MAG: hypothetical protein ACK5PF_05140 [bacterium]|jgi:hypothetical protein